MESALIKGLVLSICEYLWNAQVVYRKGWNFDLKEMPNATNLDLNEATHNLNHCLGAKNILATS